MKEISIEKGFESLQQGSHLCFIYSSREQQLETLRSFVRKGLERNEKILYVFDDRTKEEIIKYFEKKNLEIKELLDSGQFEFLTKRESYLKNGRFEPDNMFELLTKAKDRALENGFTGLRATGEMTWFFTEAPGVGQLMEYESQLNDFVQGKEMVILCQYNENEFSPENLLDVIYTHPKIILHDSIYENHYYMPPDVFASRMKEEVDRDYYEDIKNKLIQKEKSPSSDREREEEDLDTLRQTVQELEKINS